MLTSRFLVLVLLSSLVGCAPTPESPQAQPPSTTQSPVPTNPITKAKQTAVDVEQKGQERERFDPEAQPSSAP